VDEKTGRMTGQNRTYAICGNIRRMVSVRPLCSSVFSSLSVNVNLSSFKQVLINLKHFIQCLFVLCQKAYVLIREHVTYNVDI